MIRRRCLACMTVLAAAVVVAGPAGAATWLRTPLPRLHAGRGMPAFGQLLGVSCLSARWCEAVGAETGRSTHTLAERWNGSRWVRQGAPSVPRSSDTTLTSVSCTSTRDCRAVGEFVRNRTFVPLVERFDGERWSIEGSPGLVGGLASVSCFGAGRCVAVGFRGSDPGRPTTTPLLERRSAGRWSTLRAAPGASGPLQSVSCPAPSACTAVGNQESFQRSSGDFFNDTLIQRWDGTTWSGQAPAQFAGPSSTGLVAVACAAASACTASGFYDSGATGQALAERWDGSAWSPQTIDLPASVTGSRLLDVSCAAAFACAAVGGYQDRSGGQGPLAASWDGARWEPAPLGARQTFPTFELNAVSCAAIRWCMAVGDAYATRSS